MDLLRIFLWLLAVGGFGDEQNRKEWLPVNELTGDFVLSSASAHRKTFLLAPWYRKGSIPKLNMYLFDFSQAKALEIRDGRIKTSMLVQVLPEREGFVLVDNYLGNLFYFDRDGDFLTREQAKTYLGFENRFKLKMVFTFGENSLLATSANIEDPQRYRLSLIDLDRKTMTTLHEVNHQDLGKLFWIPNGRDLLLVMPELGRINLLGLEDFQKSRTLYNHKGTFKHRGRNLPLLTSPIIGDGFLFFHRNIFLDLHGKPLARPRKTTLKISLKNYQLEPSVRETIVGFDANRWLLYRKSEGEFRLIKKPI